MTVSEGAIFRSHMYPGRISASMLFLQTVVRPLVFCMLPVMILSLVAVLMEGSPLTILIWGLPFAYAAASGWTLFRLKMVIAEVLIAGSTAALRTPWDIVNAFEADWQPVFQIKRTRAGIRASIGLTVYDLQKEDWPDFEVLKETLRASAYEQATSDS